MVRTIEYANRGAAAATISLEASLVDTTPGTGGGEEGPGPMSVRAWHPTSSCSTPTR